MNTTAPDFIHAFPMPNDAEMNRAGRLGLLDQKEDDTCSDQEWIAFQHRCWIDEFRAAMHTIDYLEYCRSQGFSPATGERPRRLTKWPGIEQLIHKEQAALRIYLEGLFDNYAGYFGDEAAQLFRTFLETDDVMPETFSMQGDLFAHAQQPSDNPA